MRWLRFPIDLDPGLGALRNDIAFLSAVQKNSERMVQRDPIRTQSFWMDDNQFWIYMYNRDNQMRLFVTSHNGQEVKK